MSRQIALRIAVHALPLLLLGGSIPAFGQGGEGDTVFRFSVQGIEDPVAAKPVQMVFLEQPLVTDCVYIDECACFKVATTGDLNYEGMKGLLLEHEYHLVGDVYVSDGRVLSPLADSPEEP